jgi:hypothetical protein
MNVVQISDYLPPRQKS